MEIVNLTIEQFAMSPQQIALILKHGELESDIHRRWHRTAYEIEKENSARLLSLETVVDCDTHEFRISAKKIYQSPDGYLERFFHEEESKKIDHYEKSITVAENNMLANLAYYIACENHRRPQGVRTIYYMYDGWGKLLNQTAIIEELSPLRGTGNFIKDKSDIICANLRLPDHELDPCHHSYRGRCFERCYACHARLHCHQLKAEMNRRKQLRQKKAKN